MCVRIALITPDPCEARAFTSDEGASFTTGRGVAELVRPLILPSAWDIRAADRILGRNFTVDTGRSADYLP